MLLFYSLNTNMHRISGPCFHLDVSLHTGLTDGKKLRSTKEVVAFSSMLFITHFTKIHQLVQKLLGGQDRHMDIIIS
jgi:hypothetical protein